jgi:hypothetical protein
LTGRFLWAGSGGFGDAGAEKGDATLLVASDEDVVAALGKALGFSGAPFFEGDLTVGTGNLLVRVKPQADTVFFIERCHDGGASEDLVQDAQRMVMAIGQWGAELRSNFLWGGCDYDYD